MSIFPFLSEAKSLTIDNRRSIRTQEMTLCGETTNYLFQLALRVDTPQKESLLRRAKQKSGMHCMSVPSTEGLALSHVLIWPALWSTSSLVKVFSKVVKCLSCWCIHRSKWLEVFLSNVTRKAKSRWVCEGPTGFGFRWLLPILLHGELLNGDIFAKMEFICGLRSFTHVGQKAPKKQL